MKTRAIAIIAIICLLFSQAHAKRTAAPVVKPVNFGNDVCSTQFVAGGDGYEVYVQCTDTKTGNVSWKTRIYSEKYNDSLEHDVQDIHPAAMKLQGKLMVVTDEKGRVYRLDVMTGRAASQ